MTLDPQAKALLDQIQGPHSPPMESLSPREARMLMEVSSLGLGARPEVGHVLDITLPGPGGELRARVTAPEGPGPFPGVVFFHGGGWVTGSLNTHDQLCRALTREAGAVVVSVDYRLAPEHPFPAALDDAEAATRWVADGAKELGIDPDRLAVGGDSAGGNLAAVVALRFRDGAGPKLALQLLLYPVTDAGLDTPSYTENAEGYGLSRDAMAHYWTLYAPDPETRLTPEASPLRAPDLAGLPPALVITAGYDPLRDEAERYAHALTLADVPTRLTRYPGMIHGFIRRYNLLDQGRVALDEVVAVIRRGSIV